MSKEKNVFDKYQTKTLKFTVLGAAVGQQRVKFGNGHAHEPAKSSVEKMLVRSMCQQAIEEQHWTMPSSDMPIKVDLVINCLCPKSKARWFKEAAQRNLIVPLSKPDLDNVEKLYLDALTHVAYPDDKQVFSCNIRRQYSNIASIDVCVTGYFLNYGDIKAICLGKK
ncbi:MAG: RusA family crossover junction endodeoxyribonuclease [Ruminococcus sp.]|nr:RusA family crossover junction endodeoxyribonuclease [Ruminococcus sp.]